MSGVGAKTLSPTLWPSTHKASQRTPAHLTWISEVQNCTRFTLQAKTMEHQVPTLTMSPLIFRMAQVALRDPRTHSCRISTSLQPTTGRRTILTAALIWICSVTHQLKVTNCKLITSTMEVKSGSVRTQAANTSTQSTVKLNLQICAAMAATKMPNPLEVSKVTRLLRNLQGQGLRRRVCQSGHRIVSWQAIRARSDSKSTSSSRHSSSNSNSNSSSCHRSTKSTLIPGSSSLSKKRVPIASAARTTTTRQNKRRQLNKEACLYNKWTTSTWIASWI